MEAARCAAFNFSHLFSGMARKHPKYMRPQAPAESKILILAPVPYSEISIEYLFELFWQTNPKTVEK